MAEALPIEEAKAENIDLTNSRSKDYFACKKRVSKRQDTEQGSVELWSDKDEKFREMYTKYCRDFFYEEGKYSDIDEKKKAMIKRFKEVKDYRYNKTVEIMGKKAILTEELDFYNESTFWSDRCSTEITKAIDKCEAGGETFLVS